MSTASVENQLHIATDFMLPLDFATQTAAILAKRGVGKTYTGSVLAEEMLKVGQQVVIIDPLDVWWGLRASADGQRIGLEIVVLGGGHGDLPFDASGARAIADLVVEEGVSVVLSLAHMTKNEQRRFVTDFFERLYHRKAEDEHRQPLHIIIDEADLYTPQRVYAGQERMLGAVDDLVRRGRSRGIGVTLITQRAAVINKDVLTQIEVLVVLRTISPQDRKAIETWVEAHDAFGQKGELLESLPSLPIGTAWFWSPGWLDIFQKVQIRQRETFDSSATPRVGEQPVSPHRLAPVDLAVLREMLATSIKNARAEDPKVLRAEIEELRRQLHERPTVTITSVERVPVGIPEDLLVQMKGALGELENIRKRLVEFVSPHVGEPLLAPPSTPTPTPPEPVPTPSMVKEPHDAELDKGARGLLDVLLIRYPMRPTRQQLATLAHRGSKSSSLAAQIGALKRAGLVEESQGLLALTTQGLRALESRTGDVRQVSKPREAWLNALPSGPARMLTALIQAHPETLTRDELAARSGFSPTSSSVGAHLGVLRRNGLVASRDGRLVASDILFSDI